VTFPNNTRWIPFVNDSGEIIPAYAPVRQTDQVTIGTESLIEVAKPNGSQFVPLINGPAEVAIGGRGQCMYPSAAWCRLESGATPSVGDVFYIDDGWIAEETNFSPVAVRVVSTYYSFDSVVVAMVEWMPHVKLLGKTDASHAQGATGTVSVWTGTKGSETDSTANVTSVYNRFADVATTKWVHVEWVNGGWSLTAAECS